MSYQDFPEFEVNEAHWRATGHESMPYTEDFPECLQTLPEAIDGAISHGRATNLCITVILPSNTSSGTLIIEDNGEGIVTEEGRKRLLSWASGKSTSMHHRYGHGSKKMLTKWMKDYKEARWKVEYRTKSRRGPPHTNDLIEMTAPFLGDKTPRAETDDITSLNPSGLRWTIQFDTNILGRFIDKPVELFCAIKEIILTRYSRKILSKTQIELKVYQADKLIKKGDTSTWKTLEESLVTHATIMRGPKTNKIVGGTWIATQYDIKDDKVMRKDFPTYGTRSMRSSRVHMSLDGRFIEALPVYKIFGRDTNHNDFNGQVTIVHFIPDTDTDYESLPVPATTKVSFDETNPVFQKFKKDCSLFLKEKENSIAVVVQPVVRDIANIRTMKVDELKDWCGILSLAKSGNKTELVERLKNHFAPPKPSVEPVAPKPVAPKPVATEPVAPKPTEPVAQKPTEPVAQKPTEPVAQKPTEPVAPKPVATEPVAPKPIATEPVAPKPIATEPVSPRPRPLLQPKNLISANTQLAESLVLPQVPSIGKKNDYIVTTPINISLSIDGQTLKFDYPEGKTQQDFISHIKLFFQTT